MLRRTGKTDGPDDGAAGRSVAEFAEAGIEVVQSGTAIVAARRTRMRRVRSETVAGFPAAGGVSANGLGASSLLAVAP